MIGQINSSENGWNDDGTPATQIYARVYNKRATSGSNAITVTLTTVNIEA